MAANVWEFVLAVCFCFLLYISGLCHAENVDDFGAKGNGEADDTQAFLQAWKSACSVADAVMTVPAGKQYLLNPVTFQGPCIGNTSVQIDGTVLAPVEISAWNSAPDKTIWIDFSNVTCLNVFGKGTLDGRGQDWWACKESHRCSVAPSAMELQHCTKVSIQGLSFLNSQQIHLNIQDCKGVDITNIRVTAPEDSPNTDGVHISNSSDVTVSSSTIGTGDDCVSIASIASNIEVTGVHCGPGHGLSIGSLGYEGSSSNVRNITVSNCTLKGTTNGARIKTWQGGSGAASDIKFLHLNMTDVENPILIDQFYCNSAASGSCGISKSAVKISEVTFYKILGISKTNVGVNINCSQTVGCSGITLEDINLTQSNGSPAQVKCANAEGAALHSSSSNALSSCFSDGSASASLPKNDFTIPLSRKTKL